MTSVDASNVKLAIKNSIWSFLGVLSRIIGNSVVFLIIARLPGVGSDGFGQLTYATTLASFMVMISQFGIPTLLIRKCAADAPLTSDYFGAALVLRLGLSVICFLVALLYLCHSVVEREALEVCVLMLVAIFIGAFSIDLQSIFQAREHMHLEVIGTLGENVILLVAVCLAMLTEVHTTTVALLFIISKGLALALNIRILVKEWDGPRPSFNVDRCCSMLKEALPFALGGILAAGIIQLDTLLLRELSSSPNPFLDVSSYQAAMRLLVIPLMLPELIGKVLLPQLSRRYASAQEASGLSKSLRGLNQFLLTIGVLVGLVIFSRGEDIVDLVYGGRISAAGPLLSLLGLTLMMRFGAAYNLYFMVKGQMWFRVMSSVIGLLAILISNYVFIPLYGAVGSAYASICSHVIYWIPILLAVKAQEGVAFLGCRWSMTGLVALTMVAALVATRSIPIIYALPLYGVLCVVLAVCTLSQTDRRAVLGN